MPRLPALERFVRRSVTTEARPSARCELCGAPVGERHAHVVEATSKTARALRCVCAACAVLFRDPAAGGGRWRTVPDRVAHDPAFSPDEALTRALGLPVRLAWLVRLTDGGAVACYPSPAGAVEAAVDEAAWRALADRTALARAVEPDVEALLLRRPLDGPAACHLVPIDACYELAGLVRSGWRGIGGGDEVRRAVADFFAALLARSRPIESHGGRP